MSFMRERERAEGTNMTEALKVQGKGVFGRRHTRGTLQCGLTGGWRGRRNSWADWWGGEEEKGQCNCWKILEGDKCHFLELAG